MNRNITVIVFLCIAVATLGQKNPEYARSVAIAPDGKKIVTADWLGKISVWSLPSFNLLLSFQAHTDDKYKKYGPSIEALAFSPDGKTIASGGVYDVKLWDAATGKLKRVLGEHEPFVSVVSFSRDGDLLISHGGGPVNSKIWNVTSGKLLHDFSQQNLHVSNVRSSQFSPDDNIVATAGGDTQVKFWNPVAGTMIRSFKASRWSTVQDGKFSPDGKTYVTVSDEEGANINVWEVATGKLLKSIPSRAWRVSYSPSGQFIITANFDHMLSVWSLETGKEISTVAIGTHYFFAVAKSGDIIATGGNGFQVWRMDSFGKLKMIVEKVI